MFTYQQLLDDVEYLRFLGLDSGVIGTSESGFDIPYIHYGKMSGNQIIISGGIHARENVSAEIVIRQAYFLARTAPKLWGGVYFVPMINVDGALLIENGADFFKDKSEFLRKVNGGSLDFSMWKANINAVDLNTNFDAGFGTGVSNKSFPAPSDYTGSMAFDQCETRALRDFTLKTCPAATVSYHALGQELYWFFGQTITRERDEIIASKLCDVLGYKKIDGTLGSAGGYKDWCIEKLSIPSFTIELGVERLKHPLSMDDIESDWTVNKQLPQLLLGLV